jgi:hypothetical protein
MRDIIKAALAIPEMQFAFECLCTDDKKEPNDYTDSEVVAEAEYRLYTYFENGHINNDMRLGRDGDFGKKTAQKDVRMLKAFIKKYKLHNSFYSKWLVNVI